MKTMQYVVKLNETTDLYLKVSDPDFKKCQWSSPAEALTWSTLAQAQSVAAAIGHGTVGTTKPQ